MVKQIFSVALVGFIGLGFSGCSNKVVEPVVVPTQHQQTIEKTLTYNDTISDSPVTKSEVMQTLKANFYKSGFISKWKRYKCDTASHCRVKGRKIDFNGNDIIVYYIRGIGYTLGAEGKALFDINNKDLTRSLAVMKMPFQLNGDKNTFKLQATYPKSLKNIDYSGGATNWPPLTSTANMERDSYSSFKTLNEVAINRSTRIKGFIDIPYNEKSVKSTLERHLPYKKFKYKENSYEVEYKVYPYKNGSQIEYSIFVPYTLYQNGTASLSKKDIKGIQKEFEKIAKS